MKTGVIDVGGGERGIYGAGVFDRCMDLGITFDYLIGVSAGAANIVSFLAGQRGRNYRFYTKYSFRSEYMGLKALLNSGSFLDLEYIYGEPLTNSKGEDPLDYAAMCASEKQVEIVATDANTAEPIYYPLSSMKQDDYGAIKGSSCLPIAAKPYVWQGRALYDGGLSDPIPVERAFARGCDRVALILTRPKNDRREPKRDAFFARVLRIGHPAAGRALVERAETYNRELEQALQYEREGRLLIVAPDDISGMGTLTRNKDAIEGLYHKGLKDAEAIKDWIGRE